MKKVFSVLLVILALFLAILAFRSIMRPEKFKTTYETRKTEIRNKLTAIRAAQAVYRNEYKVYASDIDSLADFVENGNINIIKNIGNIPEGMNEADAFKAGLIKKETIVVPARVRIIETDPSVEEYLKDFRYIPHTNGKKFEIQTGSIASKTYEIPLYRIDVPIDDILANMDESITPKNTNAFTRFFNYVFYSGLADEREYRTQYGPMWMGSLTEASTSGSWE